MNALRLCVHGLAVVCFLSLVGFTTVYGNPLPYSDEWHLIPQLVDGITWDDVWWLLHPHGDHQIGILKIYYSVVFAILPLDFRVVKSMNSVFLLLGCLYFLHTLGKIRKYRMGDLAIPLILLNLAYSTSFWGFSFQFMSSTLLLLGVCSAALKTKMPPPRGFSAAPGSRVYFDQYFLWDEWCGRFVFHSSGMARMLPLDRAGDKHRASSQGRLGNSYHPEHRRHFHSLGLHQLAPIRSVDNEPFRDLYAASGYSIGFPRPPQSDPYGDPSKISYHLHHFQSAADRHSDRSPIPTSVEFIEKSESDHCRFFLTYQPGSHNRHAPQRGGWTRGVLDLWFGAALRNSWRSPGSRFVDDDFTPHAADNGLNLGIFISLCQFIPLCCELRLAGRPNQWDHN